MSCGRACQSEGKWSCRPVVEHLPFEKCQEVLFSSSALLSFLFNCDQVNALLLSQFTLSQIVTMKKTVLFPQKWKCYCAECQGTLEMRLAMSCGVCTSFVRYLILFFLQFLQTLLHCLSKGLITLNCYVTSTFNSLMNRFVLGAT